MRNQHFGLELMNRSPKLKGGKGLLYNDPVLEPLNENEEGYYYGENEFLLDPLIDPPLNSFSQIPADQLKSMRLHRSFTAWTTNQVGSVFNDGGNYYRTRADTDLAAKGIVIADANIFFSDNVPDELKPGLRTFAVNEASKKETNFAEQEYLSAEEPFTVSAAFNMTDVNFSYMIFNDNTHKTDPRVVELTNKYKLADGKKGKIVGFRFSYFTREGVPSMLIEELGETVSPFAEHYEEIPDKDNPNSATIVRFTEVADQDFIDKAKAKFELYGFTFTQPETAWDQLLDKERTKLAFGDERDVRMNREIDKLYVAIYRIPDAVLSKVRGIKFERVKQETAQIGDTAAAAYYSSGNHTITIYNSAYRNADATTSYDNSVTAIFGEQLPEASQGNASLRKYWAATGFDQSIIHEVGHAVDAAAQRKASETTETARLNFNKSVNDYNKNKTQTNLDKYNKAKTIFDRESGALRLESATDTKYIADETGSVIVDYDYRLAYSLKQVTDFIAGYAAKDKTSEDYLNAHPEERLLQQPLFRDAYKAVRAGTSKADFVASKLADEQADAGVAYEQAKAINDILGKIGTLKESTTTLNDKSTSFLRSYLVKKQGLTLDPAVVPDLTITAAMQARKLFQAVAETTHAALLAQKFTPKAGNTNDPTPLYNYFTLKKIDLSPIRPEFDEVIAGGYAEGVTSYNANKSKNSIYGEAPADTPFLKAVKLDDAIALTTYAHKTYGELYSESFSLYSIDPVQFGILRPNTKAYFDSINK